jgi:hypothetical protein
VPDLAAGSLEATHPYAAVEVVFRPHGPGSEYQATAVIDTGSVYCWIPFGIPDQHGWTRGLIEPEPIEAIGQRMVAERFSTTLQVGSHSVIVVAHELREGGWTRPLVGLDFLRTLQLEVDWPADQFRLRAP